MEENNIAQEVEALFNPTNPEQYKYTVSKFEDYDITEALVYVVIMECNGNITAEVINFDVDYYNLCSLFKCKGICISKELEDILKDSINHILCKEPIDVIYNGCNAKMRLVKTSVAGLFVRKDVTDVEKEEFEYILSENCES